MMTMMMPTMDKYRRLCLQFKVDGSISVPKRQIEHFSLPNNKTLQMNENKSRIKGLQNTQIHRVFAHSRHLIVSK